MNKWWSPATVAVLALSLIAPLSRAQTDRPSGTLVSWGSGSIPYVEPGTKFTAIAWGLALKNDGSVIRWGGNYSHDATVPVAAQSGVVAVAPGVVLKSDGEVVALASQVPVEAQSGVVAIAGGPSHIAALKNDGSVVAWGWNTIWGQTIVPVEAQSGVTAIATGGTDPLTPRSGPRQ